MINKDLKRRIIEISYKHNLSHLGSCLTAVDIIDEIYNAMNDDDEFVLSAGHAGIAQYVVLEKNYVGADAEDMFLDHGIHPERCSSCHISVSTGSLGHGLPIALGMALANRERDVYCLISDGECAEGSIWEALMIKEKYHVTNLKVYVNYNGWGAYDPIPKYGLSYRLVSFGVPMSNIIVTNFEDFPFLRDQEAHYKVMNENDYKLAMEILT